jgi:hypothetical protein
MQIIFPVTSFAVKAFALMSVLLTAGTLFFFLHRAAGEKSRRTLYFLSGLCAVYYAGMGAAASRELLADFSSFPPRILLPLVMIPLAFFIGIACSKAFGPLLSRFSLVHLTLFQMFRFFAEALIAWLVIESAMPETMTITGANFDLFAPVTAPLAAFLFARFSNRASLAWLAGWNLVAAAILVKTVVTAILSMPTPARVFLAEPALTAPALFPFYLLPGFFVPLAFAVHAASLRRIMELWNTAKASGETWQVQ